MFRTRIAPALGLALLLTILTAGLTAAHNAGCVQAGTGDYVFVGSNKDSPTVSSSNPNSRPIAGTDGEYQLDLQPANSGDQYGARHAADQGGSAVERPFVCEPSGPRAES
jgi:hypothetical protein